MENKIWILVGIGLTLVSMSTGFIIGAVFFGACTIVLIATQSRG